MVFGEKDREWASQMAREIYEVALADLNRGDMGLVDKAIGGLMALAMILENAKPSKSAELVTLNNLRIAVREMGSTLQSALTQQR